MNEEFLRMLHQDRLIGIIRTADEDSAMTRAQRFMQGGVHLLEVTWTIPQAAGVLERLREPSVMAGAGTILNRGMAQEALQSGAKYLVAPNFNPDVADLARQKKTLYIPGVFTATEVAVALEWGISLMKLFPAQTGGIGHLKSLLEPFPGVHFIVTGGVRVESGLDWLSGGAIALGMGGGLAKKPAEEIAAFLAQLSGAPS